MMLDGALKALVVVMAFAGLLWPPFFAFVLDERVRHWLARRMNDRIYRSGRGAHWKTTSGRAVGHIQAAFLFGPTFAWFGFVVFLIVLLRAAGFDLR
jgi:hypothetical protein